MKNTLHNYGLVRFSKKTGKIDTTMTAIGRGLIQLWALQNTPQSKACVIIDLTSREIFAEYVGATGGFPVIRQNSSDFEFDVPGELIDILTAEAVKRE